MLITEAIEKFGEYATDVRRLSPRTVASYSSDLGLFAKWYKEEGGARNVEDITAEIVEEWMVSRSDVSASTLQRNVASVSSLFAFLLKREIVSRNPVDLIDRPRSRDPQPVCLTDDQLQRLLDVTDGVRERAILLTMALLGLRRSEVLKLNVQDVDLTSRRLRVRNAKGGRDRTLPIPAELEPVLADHLAAIDRTADEPLFFGCHGRRISRSGLARLFSKWLNFAGLQDSGLTPHTCRHGAATRWLKAGLDLRQVQTLLGHCDLNVTAQYTHLTLDDIAEALDARVSALGVDNPPTEADGSLPNDWGELLDELTEQQREALKAVAQSMLTN